MGRDREQERREDQRRQDEKRETDRLNRKREDEKRETDRLNRKREDEERETDRLNRKREDEKRESEATRRAKAHQAGEVCGQRHEELLNDPDSYVGGAPPPSEQLRQPDGPGRFPLPPPRSVPSVSYPTPEVVLKAWDIDVRHPEVRMLSVEVNPRIGGGLQLSVDSPGGQRVILKDEELSRAWRQHRSSTGVALPMELRRTSEGPALRWLAPNAKGRTNPGEDAETSALVQMSGALAKAAWKALRKH